MLGTEISNSHASVPSDLHSSVDAVIVSVPQKTEARGSQVTLLRCQGQEVRVGQEPAWAWLSQPPCRLSAWSDLWGVGDHFLGRDQRHVNQSLLLSGSRKWGSLSAEWHGRLRSRGGTMVRTLGLPGGLHPTSLFPLSFHLPLPSSPFSEENDDRRMCQGKRQEQH